MKIQQKGVGVPGRQGLISAPEHPLKNILRGCKYLPPHLVPVPFVTAALIGQSPVSYCSLLICRNVPVEFSCSCPVHRHFNR